MHPTDTNRKAKFYKLEFWENLSSAVLRSECGEYGNGRRTKLRAKDYELHASPASTQDQIKELDVAVPHMEAQEALKRLEMRRNELAEKQHCLETELGQLQAAHRESKARGRGSEDDLLRPRSS